MYKVTFDEAKVHLPDLINAAIAGKEVFITRDNKPIVQLISVNKIPTYPQRNIVNKLIAKDDDLDAPLEDFESATHSLGKDRQKTLRRKPLFGSSGGCMFGFCGTE